jgi:hypothetical protein
LVAGDDSPLQLPYFIRSLGNNLGTQ